jgi:hypothetical protein
MPSFNPGGALGGPREACVKLVGVVNARGSRPHEGGFTKKQPKGLITKEISLREQTGEKAFGWEDRACSQQGTAQG